MQNLRCARRYWSIGANNETPQSEVFHIAQSHYSGMGTQQPRGSYKATPLFLRLTRRSSAPPRPSRFYRILQPLCPPLILPASPTYRTQRAIPLMVDGNSSARGSEGEMKSLLGRG